MIYVLTGGTGTLANALIPILLDLPDTKEVRILARNEHRLLSTAATFDPDRVKVCVGDVRNRDRVDAALRGAQAVFALHAMKQVPLCELQPVEATQINLVPGTENIIHCAIENGIKKVIYVSTDKAVQPKNFYGMVKGAAERMIINSNAWQNQTKFIACRWGNILGSQGAVLSTWEQQRKLGRRLTITKPNMTRFYMTKRQAAKFVYTALALGRGGEVFIPKMKALSTGRLMQLWCNLVDIDHIEIPIRPGEKLHEVLVSRDELDLVTEEDNYFIRWPDHKHFNYEKRGSIPKWTAAQLDEGYTSQNAPILSNDEVREMLK